MLQQVATEEVNVHLSKHLALLCVVCQQHNNGLAVENKVQHDRALTDVLQQVTTEEVTIFPSCRLFATQKCIGPQSQAVPSQMLDEAWRFT